MSSIPPSASLTPWAALPLALAIAHSTAHGGAISSSGIVLPLDYVCSTQPRRADVRLTVELTTALDGSGHVGRILEAKGIAWKTDANSPPFAPPASLSLEKSEVASPGNGPAAVRYLGESGFRLEIHPGEGDALRSRFPGHLSLSAPLVDQDLVAFVTCRAFLPRFR